MFFTHPGGIKRKSFFFKTNLNSLVWIDLFEKWCGFKSLAWLKYSVNTLSA